MSSFHDDANENSLKDFTKNALQQNECNGNPSGAIVGPEEESHTLDDDISDYNCDRDTGNPFKATKTPQSRAKNPVEVYLSDILSRLGEYFNYFDGTSNSFCKSPGVALVESATVQPPSGAEEFTFEWFGIALSLVSEALRCESSSKKELGALRPLPITIKEAWTFLLPGLSGLSLHMGRDCLRYSHSSSAHNNLPQVRAISRRILENWVRLHRLPDSISAQHSNELSDTPITCLQDLEMMVITGAAAWIASLFPLHDSLLQNVYTPNLIWVDTPVDGIDVKPIAYEIYSLCTQKSLLKNKAGLFRGVLVPKSWLRQLLDWLVKSLQDDEVKLNVSSIPGPIDVFPYMKVDLCNPSKHWLLPDKKEFVDVIPERLFCFFSRTFGSGIKYTMYGNFILHDEFLRFLKPATLTAEVSFCWSQIVDDVLEDKTVNVFVENVLHHTGMAEVIRLGYQIVKKEEGAMTAEQLHIWSAATNGPAALIVRGKNLNFDFLIPPLNIEFHTRDPIMSSVIKSMSQRLGKQIKVGSEEELSVGIELRLRLASGAETETMSRARIAEVVNRCGLCGLTNVGNTCYMNSALQCLSNLPRFRNRMLYFPLSHYPNAPLTSSVINLLTEVWSGQNECANTLTLNSIVGQKVKRFTGHQQQDASEFVEVLLDRMQEELNEVSERCYRERLDSDKNIPLIQLSDIFWNSFLENNTSFISQDFFHQSKTVFTCLTCRETSVVFDNNLTLSLDIQDFETYNVDVVVQKMLLGVSEGGAKGYAAVSMPSGLGEQIVCLSLELRLPNSGRGKATEAELKKGIRNALCECSELKERMLSCSCIATHPTRKANEPDYLVRVLEIPMNGSSKLYAWAQCKICGVVEGTDNDTRIDDSKHPEVGNVQYASCLGQYRIWYFLKSDIENLQTVSHTLVYVEELPLSLSLIQDDALDSEAHISMTGQESEQTYLSQEGTANLCGSRSAPLSSHILTLSRTIAEDFLILCSRETERSFASSSSTSSDNADDPSFSSLKWGSKEQNYVPLKGVYYSLGMNSPRDLTKRCEIDGDAWLDQLRMDHTTRARKKKKFKAMTTSLYDTVDCTDKMLNICIFLNFDARSFRTKIPRLSTSSHLKRLNSAYFGLCDGRKQPDLDCLCALHNCLEQSMMPDTLTEDNSWYCPNCKAFRETRVQRSVFRIPPCLIISFKAFKMVSTFHPDKNETPVDFPLELDFSPYLDLEAVSLGQSTVYRLRGVVYHRGSLNFGHYIACAFNNHINKWVRFDDSRFYVIEDSKPPCIGAYMLFYEREDDIQSKST